MGVKLPALEAYCDDSKRGQTHIVRREEVLNKGPAVLLVLKQTELARRGSVCTRNVTGRGLAEVGGGGRWETEMETGGQLRTSGFKGLLPPLSFLIL